MSSTERSHHIKAIHVSNLFGRYTYTIPSSNQTLSDINIVYALNGLGKTTLLKLVFHLLSPSDTRGHRSAIADIPFSELIVTLNDDTVISATKDAQLLIGPVTFLIQASGSSEKIEWNFIPNASSTVRPDDLPFNIDLAKLPDGMRADVTRAVQQRRFFQEIKKLRVVTYMLTSDRILQGDSVEERSAIDFRPEMSKGRIKLNDIVLQHRVASVTDALVKASDWVQTKVLHGSYGGGQSASGLYQDVIKRIAKSTYRTKAGLNKSQEEKVISNLTITITELERRSRELAIYGFSGVTISSEMLPAIQQTKGNRLHLINSILDPYLGGIKARLESITPIYLLVNSFVMNMNKFFSDKQLTYSLRDGFKIVVDPNVEPKQELLPGQLSSGEQQLLLLFCHVLTARDNPSVFIIDEPEISLNIAWQRMLVSSLQQIANGSNTQFLFASHSIEILTKHRSRVVSLEEK